jgi:hypothetical protein
VGSQRSILLASESKCWHRHFLYSTRGEWELSTAEFQQKTDCLLDGFSGVIVRSKILFYTGPHFSTCHPSLYCRLHVSVRPNDIACFVHTNKYFAQSLPILENSAGGGLELTTNWSITTGLLLREALLKRIRCHQTSSGVRICTECKRFRPTDPKFWT